MSTKNRRERDREAMRRRILDAAKRLFAKEGFDNVSMRLIGAAIEYSPAAIYRYFKNKREILSALRDEGFERFGANQRDRMMHYPDPIERLRAGGIGYVQFALSEPDYFQLMFCTNCEQVDLEGEMASNSVSSYHAYRSTIEECVESGYFGDIDIDTVTFAMWSGVHGLAHLLTSGQIEVLADNIEIDPLVDRILGFFLRPGTR